MTSRDLVISALNHEPVDRAPRDLWTGPGMEISRADDLAEMNVRSPSDIVPPDFKCPLGKRAKGNPYRPGTHTDAWGCTWQVTQPGTVGQITNPPLTTEAEMADYRPPVEVLSGARFGKVNRGCASTTRFVLARTETRPFDRLRLLCGGEAARDGLAAGSQPIRELLAKLHEFFCREIEMWAATDVDGVVFRDDWGSTDGLLIDLKLWRELFRPLYRDYCEILHAKDKFAFFCSAGDIYSVFGDLVKIGIDAVHSQLFLMNIERLAKRFRGQITFWGGVHRQDALLSGDLELIREAVLQVRRMLDFGSGGLIAQCQWDQEVPIGNILAVFEQWIQPLPMHA